MILFFALQPNDVNAELHDVGRQPAEPAHDEQHVLAVHRGWYESYGHDRGYDRRTKSRRVPPATGQRLLMRGRETAELRTPSSRLRRQAHLQPHAALSRGGPQSVQSERQLDRWVSTALTAFAACTLADGLLLRLPWITRYRARR